MSKIVQIEPKNWKNFLEDFSARNNDRRARFEIFKGGNVENEGQEYHFEEAKFDQNEDKLVIVRIDRAKSNAHKIHDTITNVNGISVQYDTDESESVLEITDKENELISLRFESKVDGAS